MGTTQTRPGGQNTPPPIPPRPPAPIGNGDPMLNDYVNVPRLPPTPASWGYRASGSGFPVVDVTSNLNELDFNPHRQSHASTHTQAGYSLLHGVPFQINPAYTSNIDSTGLKNELIVKIFSTIFVHIIKSLNDFFLKDAERIQRKIAGFKQTIEKVSFGKILMILF